MYERECRRIKGYIFCSVMIATLLHQQFSQKIHGLCVVRLQLERPIQCGLSILKLTPIHEVLCILYELLCTHPRAVSTQEYAAMRFMAQENANFLNFRMRKFACVLRKLQERKTTQSAGYQTQDTIIGCIIYQLITKHNEHFHSC